MSPPLAFAGLVKRFSGERGPITALAGVDGRVEEGTVTGLVGPDGAGKTTLLRLAVGLLAPDAGRLEVFGRDPLTAGTEVRARLGYMPQHFGLYEELTVAENLALYADLRGLSGAERRRRMEASLELAGLAPFTVRRVGRLSGGMKQKLALACALLGRPRLLLLDEPTVGVDPLSRRELWAMIETLAREGAAVLLSTGYLDEAERCDRAWVLERGRLLGAGPPAAFTAALAGRVFHARATGRSPRELAGLLSGAPELLDLSPDGDGLRLLARRSWQPDALAARLRQRCPGLGLAPAQARFADAFVLLLDRPVPPPPRLEPRPRTSRPAVEVEGAVKRFGDFVAVRGVSFTVRPGEVFGLLGANGAGKSTLFRMLCGLMPASGGRLSVAGGDLRRAPARARIGYLAQRFSLYGDLAVGENLDFFAGAYGLTGRRRRSRRAWALATFGLEEVAGERAGTLPLGYRQRLALAVALLHEPEVLFLDEPTSGVDPLMRRELWRWISALADSGVAVLVTTHYLEEAEYCDRLLILADGEPLACGTPGEIRQRAAAASLEEAFVALLQSRRGREAA
ncbi:MAG: ABC transporter ATP-binding protein [Porticoccaceae bacterium]|nr:MAG: ABC transporter ATP-binding protein [Porticoccaceae bacterium]